MLDQEHAPPSHLRKADPQAFFSSFCWPEGLHCPRCHATKIYQLRGGRKRCGLCKYTFHDFSQRWINRVQISPKQWLELLSLFIDGANAHKTAQAMGVSYNTAYKAMTTIRLSLLDSASSPVFISQKNDFKNYCAQHQAGAGHDLPCVAPVFGVRHENGRAHVSLLSDMQGHEAIEAPIVKKSWREVVYTDPLGEYDGLMFACCRLFRDHNAAFLSPAARVVLDGAGGFWPFARKNLANYHCRAPEVFPLYLKEQEFRYIHRKKDLTPLLAERLCAFVPNLA